MPGRRAYIPGISIDPNALSSLASTTQALFRQDPPSCGPGCTADVAVHRHVIGPSTTAFDVAFARDRACSLVALVPITATRPSVCSAAAPNRSAQRSRGAATVFAWLTSVISYAAAPCSAPSLLSTTSSAADPWSAWSGLSILRRCFRPRVHSHSWTSVVACMRRHPRWS
jgi:hypothetical protein